MISLNWIMVLPTELSAERFDEWYLGTHTLYGKASLGIVRYTVNRAFSIQPPAARGEVYRIAQEYWESWSSFEACWNSPSGHAVLGDGLVNIGLDPRTIPAITIGEDARLPVMQPARFSTMARGYPGNTDGTHVKFLAYGEARQGAEVAQWYRAECANLGEDAALREHVFGTTLGRSLRIGYLSSLPGPEQKSYDWNLELWFDDRASALSFLATPRFRQMWTELAIGRSTSVTAALVRGQEMLISMKPVPHLDE